MRERLVIVGNGMVGARLLSELARSAPGRYDVTIVGAEPCRAYSRILLSSYLAGECAEEDLWLTPDGWHRANGVTCLAGAEIVAIHRETRCVVAHDGREIPYDRLVLAVGSDAIRLKLPGAELPDVFCYRDRADAAALLAAAPQVRRAVVIGGGLLGLEAAHGLARQGLNVEVVHLAPTLMERQLDAPAGDLLRAAIEARGIACHVGAETARILGARRVEAVELADGRILAAGLVVIAVGIRPRTELARAAGLACRRGILVDDGLATSDPAIFAIGECAEHRGNCYGLVAPLYDQAAILARRLAGEDAASYAGSAVATSLKVAGIDVFSAGDFADASAEAIVLAAPASGIYRKLFLRDDRLVGAVLYGDAADGPWYHALIAAGRDVAAMRGDLAFGRTYAEAPPALAAE
jgi:nitrite reductase (NADH) large subunit